MKLPMTLNDIELQSYQRFVLIEEPTNEDLVKCLLNINQIELNKLKASEVDELVEHLSNLLKQETPFKPTFTLNGIQYGFIPNLDDITYGENKDITSYINDLQSLHKAMAVAYRPVKLKHGNKYQIEEYEGSHKYSEVMKEAPLSVVLGMVVFFCNLTTELLRVIPNYLNRELQNSTNQGLISEKNGAIIQNYTHSLKVILEDLTQLQKSVYIHV